MHCTKLCYKTLNIHIIQTHTQIYIYINFLYNINDHDHQGLYKVQENNTYHMYDYE